MSLSPRIDGDPRPAISVVIRMKTAENEVFQVIDALLDQTLPPSEIIVVDSGSTAGVLDEVRRRAAASTAPPIRLFHLLPERYQSARTLNLAIRRATGSLVAIISQDAIPADRDYLQALAQPLIDNDTIAGTYGRQVLKEEHCPFGEKDLAKTYPATSRDQRAPDCWFVNTCSMIRRDLWSQHPFQPAARISEDHEWAQWAQSQGFLVRYEATAVVRHYHYFVSWQEHWQRYYDEGAGLRRMGKRWGLLKSIIFAARETVSDALWFAPRGYLLAIAESPLRRTLKYLAYWAGNQAGRPSRRR